jgi:hypothetical protein
MALSSGAQKVFLQKRTPGPEAKKAMATDTGMDFHPSNIHWNIYKIFSTYNVIFEEQKRFSVTNYSHPFE